MADLKPSDSNSPVRFVSPLTDKLLVRTVQGEEEIGGLFVFELELISTDNEMKFDDVVGQQVTTILVLEDDERFFNGYITEFRYLGIDGPYSRYHATIRPWFWLLTRTSDCRIFQKMKVTDIIKEVYRLNNMTDFEERYSGTYREWDYCVQYNESDFDFVSRLMEQEGIYYFFEHKADKHVLVMADDASAHETFPGFAEIPFNSNFDMLDASFDSLDTWAAVQSIMPGKYAIQDYDFENPKVDLLAKFSQKAGHTMPINDPEIFDYPGEYVNRDEGTNYVEIRLQELQCKQERMHATGGCRGLSPGYKFNLTDFKREDQNKEYLTVSISHEINNNGFFSGEDTGETVYRCKVEVMDVAKMPFRTPRRTPKPIVRGPQTAIVVGPSGDEIYTDKYGRVKVQFHWDRYGGKDENSSCWVRVSQLWAGAKWGGIHIPRIGQEVVVSFLEGDPDRPLITGSVYNANCMPPYTLEANKTQSGIKSRSSMDGGPDNFNEIRMEDKKGSEELYIHAEKDQNNIVENDETTNVGHDRTEDVGNNETISIGNNRQESVGNDETISIGNDRQETVGNDEAISVSNNRTRNVGKEETINIGESRTHSVGKDESILISDDQNVDIGKKQLIQIGADQNLAVGGERATDVGKDDSLVVGKKLVIDVGDSVTLKCGSAKITMKKDGTVSINGKDLTLKGSGKINVKASAKVTIKGSQTSVN